MFLSRESRMNAAWKVIFLAQSAPRFSIFRRNSLRNPDSRSLRNTKQLCSAVCSVTLRCSPQYEEGYSKVSPAVVSSAIASVRLRAQEPLEECIEFRRAVYRRLSSENRCETATKYPLCGIPDCTRVANSRAQSLEIFTKSQWQNVRY